MASLRLLATRLFPSALLLLAAAPMLAADDDQAETLLRQGRVGAAASMLQETLSGQPYDARAHELLCRVFYAQDMPDPAVRECEQAARDDASNSDNEMWLGRTYGLKASQANVLNAFSIARKVHVAFEQAVRLNPANLQAMSDLGQFYVAAPAIVGGGTNKAQALVPQILPHSAAKAHRLLGLIAQKKNDPAAAEAEFKQAIASAKTPEAVSAAWVDLGLFYQQQSQPDLAVEALKSSIQANHIHNASLVDAASILTELHREPELAEKLLRDYLASPAKSDEAPAFKVHLQLGDILKKRGDMAGAQLEYAAALELAPDFVPARKAAQSA